MTGPALDARRFLLSCLLGIPLGIYYSFLRPLGVRHPITADLLFLPALFYGWLYLGFGICAGDIRLIYCAGLGVGIFLWDRTLGRWLQPAFKGLWRLISRICRGFRWIFKKIFKKTEKN